MSFGIAELISLLLGMQGFGLQANPKAPSPDASLEYAMADADVVGHIDAASIVPGNYKVLTHLADQPDVKASPELAKVVRQVINEIEGPRGLAKAQIGFDPITDIDDATAFFQVVPNHDPSFVVSVHGKFSTAVVDKVAAITGKTAIKAAGGAWVDSGDNNALAVTKNGVMLVGTPSLIKDRMTDTWKAPPHGPGTNLGYAAEVLGQKPVFAVILTMSKNARTAAVAGLGGENFATDLIKRHKVAAFGVYHDGIGWTWGDSNQAGLDAMASISDGFVDILRAAQIAPRGFGKIVLGGLESYRGNKQIDAILAHKADITKIVNAYTGDGLFKVKLDKDPKSLRLNVRLTGKSLSEVVPVGVLLPLGAWGALMKGRTEPELNGYPMAPQPAKPPTSSTGKKTK